MYFVGSHTANWAKLAIDNLNERSIKSVKKAPTPGEKI